MPGWLSLHVTATNLGFVGQGGLVARTVGRVASFLRLLARVVGELAVLWFGLSVALTAYWEGGIPGDPRRWAWDSIAYYEAWAGGLYTVTPGESGAYNYSPVFAQLVWPLTHLPFVVFAALFTGAAVAGVWWLLRPVPLVLKMALWIMCLPEIFSGNVYWLLAVAAVVGFARPGWWAVAAFTKITPCLGPVWFLVRGEWKSLRSWGVWVGGLALISLLTVPQAWAGWIEFLTANSGGAFVGVFFWTLPFPWRIALALGLTVVGARMNRSVVLPFAMVIASPVVGPGTYALLAAVPRLWLRDRAERQAGSGGHGEAPGPEAEVIAPAAP